MSGIRDFFQKLRDVEKYLDDPGIMERAKRDNFIMFALQFTRYPNWWGSGVGPDRALEIARDDAIPLAWVPRSAVVKSLAAAENTADRQATLLASETLILEDCRESLDRSMHPELVGHHSLVVRAIDAYEAGHREAAMALAVSVGEPLALWASEPRETGFLSEANREAWKKLKSQAGKYGQARLVLVNSDRYTIIDSMDKALLAPIPHFFTPWWPDGRKPMPSKLSRHVVAHQPTPEHFNHFNSLTSIMLVTSLLRAQCEWATEVEASDALH